MRFRNLMALVVSAGVACAAQASPTADLATEGTAAATTATDSSFDAQPLSLDAPQYLADAVRRAPRAASPAYKGGRGLITLQGMSGMFLNPTSGTLDQGQLTVQYCLYVDRFDLNNVVGHGIMASYGVTDWLEVGAFGNLAEIDGFDRRWFDDPVFVGGPFARIRLLKDEGSMPELSVGGIYLDGSEKGDVLYRAEAFVALSKGFNIDPDGTFKSVRLHGGLRYASRSDAVSPGDFALVYGGVELELPYSLYLIGEVSSNNLLKKGGIDLPYAVGVQWKPNSVLGISVAFMNPELLGLQNGFWFGVGVNFKI